MNLFDSLHRYLREYTYMRIYIYISQFYSFKHQHCFNLIRFPYHIDQIVSMNQSIFFVEKKKIYDGVIAYDMQRIAPCSIQVDLHKRTYRGSYKNYL